ncbi:TPA: ATP-binding protein [Legionella pneumophila]|nr:ATP-binding protein [Legionella pneumophila]
MNEKNDKKQESTKPMLAFNKKPQYHDALPFNPFIHGTSSETLRLNSSSSEEKKIHPAIEYFRQLQMTAPSIQLKEFLSSFTEPKSIDSETFAEGVKKFIQLANSNPLDQKSSQGRRALYGTIYSGLHYNNDLVKLWNAAHMDYEPIKASHLTTLAPSGWDSTLQDGFITLIYKGQQPAQALDELVKGPTVIDCGMFTQLSLWFGLRYMLGNERFNQCFGRTPFFITQSVYNGIEDSNKPFTGNPLYSFLAKKDIATISSVTVKHLSNTPLYPFKHPGGNYGGDNCIVIGDQYYIFDPHLEDTQGVTEAFVLKLLRDSFNEGRKPYDIERLSLYAATPEEFHPKLFQTFGQLIEEAENLRDKTFSEEEFSHVKQNPELELTFDLHKFSIWLQRLENTMQPDSIDYLPRPIDYSLMPTQLLDVIPFENRTSMDFFQFKQESPQQQELMIMSKQFCQSIMTDESKLVILTGKAGVGKTASAVCAAKELTTRGKKVVWISEVMVNGWADQAKSITDLNNCGLEIDKLLSSDPDVVFLDDDNLAGFSGNLLLEKIYSWYVSNPGKGLFITSNEPIRFKDCYGYKLDRKYYYPPFNDYNSPQYLNWQHKSDLAGMSLRSKRDGQSIGAIVSDLSWKTNERNLGQIELIPGFDSDDLPAISRALQKTGSMQCRAYDNLRLVQKKWIRENKGQYWDQRGHHTFHVAITKHFEKTTYKTIALELREYNDSYFGKEIDSDSIDQLIRVLNYAHDQGGRRIILINQTSYSREQLLIQIKAQLPKSESERTWSRLMLLLCETEDSIFSYDQFNGHIEVAPPERSLLQESSHDFEGLSMFKRRPTRLSTQRMGRGLLFNSFLPLEGSAHENNSTFGTPLQDLDLQSILSKIQLSFFSAEKPSVKLKGIEPSKSEANVQKCSAIPREMFTEQLRKQEEEFLIEHRHDNAELQHEYDKRFGMILRK